MHHFVSSKKVLDINITTAMVQSIPLTQITEDDAKHHLKSLTFEVKDSFTSKRNKPICLAKLTETDLNLPRAYMLKHFDVKDNIKKNPLQPPSEFNGVLCDKRSQVIAGKKILDALEIKRGAVLCLPCGFGKTVVSLYIACKRGGKTLILVHKTSLLQQWIERINQYCPNSIVGIMQGKTNPASDCTFVVGMFQTVSMREYNDPNLVCNTLIVDEAHHVPAVTFTDGISKVNCNASLGLTATPNRVDGLTPILYAFMGDIEFCIKRQESNSLRALVLTQQLPSNGIRESRIRGSDNVNISKMITDICQDDARNDAIVSIIIDLINNDLKRHVIVLSDRTKQLQILFDKVTARGNVALKSCPYGGARICIGSTKKRDRIDALKARVVLTTFAFSSEGVDEPRLDTLIMASPKGNVTQSVGRILREHDEKQTPVIYDFSERFHSGVIMGLSAKRRSVYKKHNFNIQKLEK